LKLHRFDVFAANRVRFVAKVHLQQIADKFFGDAWREAKPRACQRFGHRLQRSRFAQPLETKTRSQFLGKDRRVRGQLGDVLFAHSKNNPQQPILAKRIAHLLKKAPPITGSLGIKCEEFLKLIENEKPRLG
jgi:hypothetical protein